MPEPIPHDILACAVDGVNLGAADGTLAGVIGERPTLLVFLRHFGCAFCRETVKDLRRLSGELAAYPPVLFFYTATPDEGRSFFEQYWPDARAVSDPAKQFYTAFGIRQATLGQTYGIRVWTCHFRAMTKGSVIGKPIGDPWIMPGAFLVHGADVLWSHPYKHQGDRPDWTSVPGRVPAAAVAGATA
jgi:hypothetical protein